MPQPTPILLLLLLLLPIAATSNVKSGIKLPWGNFRPAITKRTSTTTRALSGEPCTVDSDCDGARRCTNDSGLSCRAASGEADPANAVCFCASTNHYDLICDCSSPSCLAGETCRQTNVCLAQAVEEPVLQCGFETPPPDLAQSGAGRGLGELGHFCGTNADCMSRLQCMAIQGLPCEGSEFVLCVCNNPPEVSPTPDAEPSAAPVEGKCVDAELLKEFAREELVFDDHVDTEVWCDLQGSCATAGHMVRWNGQPMMMKSYCQLGGVVCEKKVIQVNSPRFKRGLNVATKTDGLVFTAFAAKYETRGEEMFMAAAVRMGL